MFRAAPDRCREDSSRYLDATAANAASVRAIAGVIIRQPVDHAVQRNEADRRDDAGLTHIAAEQAAQRSCSGNEGLRPSCVRRAY